MQCFCVVRRPSVLRARCPPPHSLRLLAEVHRSAGIARDQHAGSFPALVPCKACGCACRGAVGCGCAAASRRGAHEWHVVCALAVVTASAQHTDLQGIHKPRGDERFAAQSGPLQLCMQRCRAPIAMRARGHVGIAQPGHPMALRHCQPSTVTERERWLSACARATSLRRSRLVVWCRLTQRACFSTVRQPVCALRQLRVRDDGTCRRKCELL